MRHNRFLLLTLMQVLLLSASADEYTDPITNVVYSYTKGSGVATITGLADISGEESGQVVTGDITILDKFMVDDEEYVVTSISDGAFCSDDLMHIVSEIEDPFEISTSTFSPESYQKGTLVVPVGTVEKYKLQVGWRDFEEIVEMGHEPQTEFIVNVEQEGMLNELVTALNANKIRSLTIKGRLNGTDIKYLRENETLQNYLDSLDLGEVTLVPGGESYYTYVIPGDDGDYWSNTTYYIYLSDHEKMTHLKTTATGWGTQSYNKWESDALPYAFVGMNFTLKKIVLPAGLPKIGEHMFTGFEKLGSVVAPEHITEIRESAFSGCSSLVQIEGMDISHLQIIDKDAFSGCAKLKLGTLNLTSAKRIGEKAFSGCGKLSELVLGDDLEYVGRGAFSRCVSLTAIKYNPEVATLYSYNSFDDWWMNSLPVEDNIVYMGRTAMRLQEEKATPSIMKFRDGTLCVANGFAHTLECKYIQQIELPATIKHIGDESFYSGYSRGYSEDYMTNIQKLKLPEGLLEIGEYAFSSSKQLTELTIPESVERIGRQAFSDCEAMSSLKLNGCK